MLVVQSKLRIRKATAWADQWLALEHDFSTDESMLANYRL